MKLHVMPIHIRPVSGPARLRSTSKVIFSNGGVAMRCRMYGRSVVLVVSASAAIQDGARAQDSVTAFVNVAVIPMDRERVLREQTIVVRGDRIVALGPAKQVSIPAGARRVDGQEKFLMPGLADMHSHTSPGFRFLANGITAMRDPGSERKSPEGLGPRVLYPAPTIQYSSSPEAAVRSIGEMKAAGDQAIKLPASHLPPGVYDSVLAVTRREKLGIVGHVPADVGTLDSAGTVAVGKQADLILLDGNPLADIHHTAELAGVMAAGRWIPRDEIRARMDSLAKQP